MFGYKGAALIINSGEEKILYGNILGYTLSHVNIAQPYGELLAHKKFNGERRRVFEFREIIDLVTEEKFHNGYRTVDKLLDEKHKEIDFLDIRLKSHSLYLPRTSVQIIPFTTKFWGYRGFEISEEDKKKLDLIEEKF